MRIVPRSNLIFVIACFSLVGDGVTAPESEVPEFRLDLDKRMAWQLS
jgi:hypothetical protein